MKNILYAIAVKDGKFIYVGDRAGTEAIAEATDTYVKGGDGVNDAGLVCNINVVNQADIEKNMHSHTNPGKPQIMIMNLVRALLDNCGSVAEAIITFP